MYWTFGGKTLQQSDSTCSLEKCGRIGCTHLSINNVFLLSLGFSYLMYARYPHVLKDCITPFLLPHTSSTPGNAFMVACSCGCDVALRSMSTMGCTSFSKYLIIVRFFASTHTAVSARERARDNIMFGGQRNETKAWAKIRENKLMKHLISEQLLRVYVSALSSFI